MGPVALESTFLAPPPRGCRGSCQHITGHSLPLMPGDGGGSRELLLRRDQPHGSDGHPQPQKINIHQKRQQTPPTRLKPPPHFPACSNRTVHSRMSHPCRHGRGCLPSPFSNLYLTLPVKPITFHQEANSSAAPAKVE